MSILSSAQSRDFQLLQYFQIRSSAVFSQKCNITSMLMLLISLKFLGAAGLKFRWLNNPFSSLDLNISGLLGFIIGVDTKYQKGEVLTILRTWSTSDQNMIRVLETSLAYRFGTSKFGFLCRFKQSFIATWLLIHEKIHNF